MPASCANAFAPTTALFGAAPKLIVPASCWLTGYSFSSFSLALVRKHIGPHLERRRNLFQRRIARALADAVDRALHLPRAGANRRQRIRHRQSQIVVAVR